MWLQGLRGKYEGIGQRLGREELDKMLWDYDVRALWVLVPS